MPDPGSIQLNGGNDETLVRNTSDCIAGVGSRRRKEEQLLCLQSHEQEDLCMLLHEEGRTVVLHAGRANDPKVLLPACCDVEERREVTGSASNHGAKAASILEVMLTTGPSKTNADGSVSFHVADFG
jgi:hypothetical protein